MPAMKYWQKRKRVPPIAITFLTIVFLVLQWDSRTGNIQWNGAGKYVNYAFSGIAIVCAVLYLVGYYRKKLTPLMIPILFVLGFGILFGLTAAICFPLGLDITGSTSGQMKDNSTHIEILATTTTIAPNIIVSTTESSSNADRTPKEKVYMNGFAINRSVVCLILLIFHYINYVDKVKKRKEEEGTNERDAAYNAMS